uniref:Uncharacterized protein n=1 Tax=Riptortus pedestris TaxID=329032 RepID=R4WCM1_RIPPE|nr:hypothetical protein [Riptortus pedestris]
MERWRGKVAVVTGATAGIGRAIAQRLAQEGLKVVAIGRRAERLKELAESSNGKIHAMVCDVTKEEELVNVFKKTEEKLGPVHVLVNNAGTFLPTQVTDGDIEKWRHMFELNVLSTGTALREALKSMKKNGIDDGYIINISSISSHAIPEGTGKHIYNATKHALRVITEGARQELARKKSKIRISTICPGVVDTEIFDVPGGIGREFLSDKVPRLTSEDIAQNTVDLLRTPPNAHVVDMVVRPLGETLLA